MPRSPLLSMFRRLAADHAAAERAGLSVEELRERRAGSPNGRPSAERMREGRRRFVLGAAGATAAAALLPRRARAANYRVAIVGGGISGMAAALTLADAGVMATVYESNSRIGGRMFSNMSGYWNDGQVSEWGGELVDTAHKTIQSLCRRFNLPLDDLRQAEPNGSSDTYMFGGAYYTADQASIDFQPVHQALQNDVQAAKYPSLYNSYTQAGWDLDHMSVYDWIESRVPGGHASPLGKLLDVAYNIEYGGETTDQSALNLVYLLGYKAGPGNFNIFGASDERYHIRGGNQQLPLAIANALGNQVQLSWRMQAIALNSDGSYTLTFSTPGGTRTTVADRVILTLPFAVLRTLDYSRAGFDPLKVTAITQLGASRNGKLQLQFSRRYWNGYGAWPGISNGLTYADTGYQNTWDVTRAQPGLSGILVDYTGANVTLGMKTKVAFTTIADKNTQADAARFLSQIEPVYPGLSSLWNGKATSSIPHLDPNFNLAYSYWRVGQYTAFSGYEKAPQGNCFFGGEHCSQDFQGFMEGGASEGVRAANEVLHSVGIK